MKQAMCVAAILSACCFAANAQTVSVQVLDQSGAQAALAAAVRSAEARHAPSAIAVVDPAGDLLAFERMDGVRPASVELAIQKAHTAARLQRPTAEIENNINHGRTAFVTADIPALQGGTPIRVGNQVVGAVGVAGLSKETDVEISAIAAAALSPPQTSSAPQSPPSRWGHGDCHLTIGSLVVAPRIDDGLWQSRARRTLT